jgi:hypothetical protein
VVIGDTDLDLVMPPDLQERFEKTSSYNDGTGRRTRDDALRRRLAPRYERFRQRSVADQIERILRAYIPLCVPAYLRTELSFWSLSVPAGQPWVYARLNVGWQEVVTVFEDWDGTVGCSFHVAATPLGLFGARKPSRDALARRWRVKVKNDAYDTGGPDQVQLIGSLSRALWLLKREPFVRAARRMNLRLMRKRASPYGRYHCFAFADRVLPAPRRSASSRREAA